MDYAAALRATPAGPAVRLNTAPAAKAQPQKVAIAKPIKVEVVESVQLVEEDTVLSVAVPSAPVKPPTNAGLSPLVRFVITVPSSASPAKESSSAPAESNAETSDSSSDSEEDASGSAATNGAKSNKNEAKVHNFSAQDLDNNFAHLSDLVALLEKHAEEPLFELVGGFRFSKSAKNGGKAGSSAIHDLELPTVTLSLKWLSSLIELLRSKTSTTIAAGGGAFVSIARVEGQIRVIRLSNGAAAGKEVWLQFEDVVLEVREQAKLYLQVANRIEQVLERREAQLADKLRKDAGQRRRAISNKLHTAAFTSMLDTLHGLLAGSTEFPALSKRFHDQEAHLAQQRRRVKEENQDMMAIFLSIVPSNLLEANLTHIAAQLEPTETESSVDASSPSGAAATQASEKKDKKLSKKEQIAAAQAAAAQEAESKKAHEAVVELARKDAEKARRDKQEKLALLQAEQKKKQLVANPFAHLDGFSESAAAQLESEAEIAKEKQIKKAAESKVKQEKKAAVEAEQAAADAKNAQAARNAKTSAAAQDSLKRQAVDDAKRAANKEVEDKKKAAAKEADEKKKAAAARQAAEHAAAAKKKQEKAEKVAAEKAAADERKKTTASPAPVAEASSSAPKKDTKVPGPDRSEKQRKAEKIEHQQKEKQRAKEIRQIGLAKKSDNTMLYAAIGGGAVIALLIAYFIFTQMKAGTLSN